MVSWRGGSMILMRGGSLSRVRSKMRLPAHCNKNTECLFILRRKDARVKYLTIILEALLFLFLVTGEYQIRTNTGENWRNKERQR